LIKLFGDKTLAESMHAIIIIFLSVAVCITFLYWVACGLLGTSPSGSDVANIFVASATLLGPIILVFTLNAWNDQHNKNLSKDIALVCWDAVTLNMRLLEDIISELKVLDGFKKQKISERAPRYMRQLREIEQLKKLYRTANYDALLQVLKVKSLSLKILNVDPYVAQMNKTNSELNNLENANSFIVADAERLANEMLSTSTKILNQLDKLIKA
jgi:hypothetical protein